MDPLVLLPYAGGLLALLYGAHLQQRRGLARLRTWRSVAERIGLRVAEAEASVFRPAFLEARDEGRKARFEHRPGGKKVSYTWITVSGDSGLTLQPERSQSQSFLTRDLRDLGRREEPEIELGDETFDAAVEVRGAPERVRALLDADTRAVVLAMLAGTLHVTGRRPLPLRGSVEMVDGNLRAVLDDQPSPPTPQELRDTLLALFDLAERFRPPREVAARLAASLAGEPIWQVRLHGLRLLATSFPDHAATPTALRRALDDEHPEVVIDAALLIGQEGIEKLVDLVGRGEADDAVAAQAVHALGDLLPVEVGLPLLHRSLRLRRIATAKACIHALATAEGEEVEELLSKVVSIEQGELAVEAAKALRRRAGGEAEETLLRALGRGDPDLTLAAVEALGHVGSVRAVPFLRDAGEASGASADLRRAARQAVAEIQSRLPGASPGQLSLAGGEAGRVSLADDDPRGQVSFPEPAPGAG